jgi:hypothetical protein
MTTGGYIDVALVGNAVVGSVGFAVLRFVHTAIEFRLIPLAQAIALSLGNFTLLTLIHVLAVVDDVRGQDVVARAFPLLHH